MRYLIFTCIMRFIVGAGLMIINSDLNSLFNAVHYLIGFIVCVLAANSFNKIQ